MYRTITRCQAAEKEAMKQASHTRTECHEEFVEHETHARARWWRTSVPPACREMSRSHDALKLSNRVR